MRQLYLYLLICYLLFSGFMAKSQDIIFSQPFVNQMIYNPAATGIGGGTTVGSNYRMQWPRIDGSNSQYNYQAISGAIDVPCLKTAVGMYFLRGNEGIVDLESQTVGLSVRFKPVDWFSQFRGEWDLNMGLAFSYNWLEVDFRDAVFSDQLDPFDGLVSGTQAPIPYNFLTGDNYMDLGAGVLLHRTFGKPKSAAGTDAQGRKGDGIRLGAMFNHLVRADHSVMGRDDTTTLQLGLQVAYFINRGFGDSGKKWKFQMVPMFRYFSQRPSTRSHGMRNEFAELGLGFNLKEAPGLFGAMFWRRNLLRRSPGEELKTDFQSLVFLVGIEVPGQSDDNIYRFSFSYDYNYAGIRSDGFGAWELGITIHFTESALLNNCPSIRAPWDPCNRIF